MTTKVLLSGVHFEYTPQLLNPNGPYSAQIIPALIASKHSRDLLRQNLLHMLALKH